METESYKTEGHAIDKSFRFSISHHFFWETFPKLQLVNEVQFLGYHIYHTILCTTTLTPFTPTPTPHKRT